MIILIGLPFFKGISNGWIYYYNQSSGPKFTEEQIRYADQAARVLDDCHPVTDLLSSETHFGVCKSLKQENFLEASKRLEMGLEKEFPFLTKKALCLEALKIGVWLLGSCVPNSIRDATYNLLACDIFFKEI